MTRNSISVHSLPADGGRARGRTPVGYPVADCVAARLAIEIFHLAFNSGLTGTDVAAARLARNGDLTVSVGYATLANLKISGNHLLALNLNLRSQHFCRPIHQPEIMAGSRDG